MHYTGYVTVTNFKTHLLSGDTGLYPKPGWQRMKLKLVRAEIPEPVVRWFPHLETELHEMAMNDENFSQLCRDYQDMVETLKHTNAHKSDTRTDLLSLKTTLEVEILEHVSRRGVLKRN